MFPSVFICIENPDASKTREKKLLKSYIAVAAAVCGVALAQTDSLAQAPSAEPEFATIAGVALDSIRGGYLRNAIITVSGTNRTALTDSVGRFTIDSVVPGEHTLRIRHALLDSIGLLVVTPRKKIGPGETMAMLVATPGPATIVAAKCTAEARALGPAAVLGTVFDAETEDPSAGARVSTTWSELQLGRKSISRVPQQRTAQVSPDGTFRLCGLPKDLASGIGASRGADTTASVPVNLASGLAILALHLPPASTAAAASTAATTPAATAGPTSDTAVRVSKPITGRAVVEGRITDAENKPVAGARVAIEEDRLTATTDADGRFRISGGRSGTRSLTVRKLGYEPVRMTVELKPPEAFDVDLKLAPFVPVLQTVTISAIRDQALQRNGFAERRHQGFGTFITPEALARRNPMRVNDMLRGVSFLRFYRQANGKDMVTGRPSVTGQSPSGCVRYWVDNTPWVSYSDTPDDFYHPSEIGAIEVYKPAVTPPRFMSFSQRGELCYAIVLWTQSGLQLR